MCLLVVVVVVVGSGCLGVAGFVGPCGGSGAAVLSLRGGAAG